jgi:DNA-binding transcriptional LysR family regulator
VAAFDELKQSVRDIDFLSDPAKGDVKIRCHESFAATIGPLLIRRFSAIYPHVVVHLEHHNGVHLALPALRNRECDLIVGRQPMPLADEDLNIDLVELLDEPWILQAPHTGNYRRLNEAFQARGLAMPKSSLVTLSMPIIIDFLANGPFIAAYPRSVVLHNALTVLPVDLTVRPWPVVITTLKNRTQSPVVERFIECARVVAKTVASRSKSHSSKA